MTGGKLDDVDRLALVDAAASAITLDSRADTARRPGHRDCAIKGLLVT